MKKVRLLVKHIGIFTVFMIVITSISGCRFGFASDPDVDIKDKQEITIDMSNDTFQYDKTLDGTKITILNSKAEIQVALEEIAKVFEKLAGVNIDVISCGNDSPYTRVVNMYNSGTPPTLAILDTTDVLALSEEKAIDLSDEKWIEECSDYLTKKNGKVYSFPFCIEGRGIIYNKKAIEEKLGFSFDASSITSFDKFKDLLSQLINAGMDNPVSLAKEDWSLGGHQLQYIYETYDGTSDGADKIINQLKNGEIKLEEYNRYIQLLDTFDLLKENSIAKGDPLGADYDEMAIDLADGETAFWFNGNWAWPNLLEAGAKESDEYGFLPYFLGNDINDFTSSKIQASPSKQVMLDKQYATDNQKMAAKEFLNWLVYSNVGQQMLVKKCALIPACKNNPYEPSDPLSRDIYEKMQVNKTYNAAAIVPNDHWKVLGASMQKYLAGRSNREELASSIENYWIQQNK